MDSIAVVGIGNNLLQDDGVGIHALHHYEAHHAAPDVCCLDAGTVGLALMDRLANLQGLVAVDAMRLGKPPGTVTVLEGEAMDRHLRNHHGSVHELGLSDILDALRLCGDLPANRALVGIEPESVDWGTEPTSKVAAAIPSATARIRDLVLAWRGGSAPEVDS
jgi:hydrogenase maturation protease